MRQDVSAAPPMTLGNMRANGVRSLMVYCPACHRSIAFNVDAYSDGVPVPAFSPRMVCTACGMIGADARPTQPSPPTARRSGVLIVFSARDPAQLLVVQLDISLFVVLSGDGVSFDGRCTGDNPMWEAAFESSSAT